jgi:hypothetical protein
MTDSQLEILLRAERQICDTKLEGLRSMLEEALKGRDKAVELLVSSQGQRLNLYIAILVAIELALKLWGK